jgi:hypothetical protein
MMKAVVKELFKRGGHGLDGISIGGAVGSNGREAG